MAVTARTISPEKSSGGVIVRPPSWSPVSVTLPSALTVPAERTAPSGMPEMVISRLSEPSRSVSRASRSSAIGLSSVPEAGVTASTGASATASTVTVRLSVVVAVLPLSSIVVAGVNVQLPSALGVPAESTAPSGMPEIVTEDVSSETDRLSSIAVSSRPSALLVVRSGAWSELSPAIPPPGVPPLSSPVPGPEALPPLPDPVVPLCLEDEEVPCSDGGAESGRPRMLPS